MATSSSPVILNPVNGTVPTSNIVKLVCYPKALISRSSIWKGENPLDYPFILFLLQVLVIILTTHTATIILQPLRQSRYISGVLGGLILGPSVMGRISSNLEQLIFPSQSIFTLDAIAHLGLIYYMFLFGLETNTSMIRKSTRPFVFAATCLLFPLALLGGSGLIPKARAAGGDEAVPNVRAFIVFLCVTLTVTTFSMLARTLAEMKLLHTEIATTALSAGMLIDICAWIFLSISSSIAHHVTIVATLYTIVSGLVFHLICFKVVRPAAAWIVGNDGDEEVAELPSCVILVGVLVAAIVGDAIGINAISGAFLYGLVIPHGHLASTLVERLDDVVEGMLLPLYFALCGLRTDVFGIDNLIATIMLSSIILVAAGTKVAGCVIVGYLCEMPLRDGLAVGLLMNFKGIIELVVLNIGLEKKIMNEKPFAVMVMMSVFITTMASPLLSLAIKPTIKQLPLYIRRTVQWPDLNSELCLLFCLYSPRNVPSMFGLLDAHHPSKDSPLSVLALHLIELTGRASAMLIVHSTAEQSAASGGRSLHIVQALESYEKRTAGVNARSLTAVSPFTTMHIDICAVAQDQSAALIVLPFYKQHTIDGTMEATNPAIRDVTMNVLTTAPCSVAIIVDRGIRGSNPSSLSSFSPVVSGKELSIVALFLGGPDGREALSLASRMVANSPTKLTILRFIIPEVTTEVHQFPRHGHSKSISEVDRVLTLDDAQEMEEWTDDAFIAEIRQRHVNDENVEYKEIGSSGGVETMEAIRALESGGVVHDLYVVGRSCGSWAEMFTGGMAEWNECPELGPIGDLLASPDFGCTASVLVVQQSVAVDLLQT